MQPTEPVDPQCDFSSLNIFHCRNKVRKLCRSNCRSIEVSVLYPPCTSPSLESSSGPRDPKFGNSPADSCMSLHAKDTLGEDLSPVATRDSISPTASTNVEDVFPFMELPAEIRVKVYGYLLSPRTHTIVTQYPHNGYFYNTSTIPAHSAQSFYTSGGTTAKNRLTTYKVLNTNPRADTPSPSIFPQIFRVCKQIREEAEPVLYGASETVFDFDVHLEAAQAFLRDRSAIARASVRNVRIAKETPKPVMEDRANRRPGIDQDLDPLWISLCDDLRSNLPDLRTLDLTIWSSSSSAAAFLPANSMTQDIIASTEDPESVDETETGSSVVDAKLWREWEWTRALLRLEALKATKVTWWGFNAVEGEWSQSHFYSWLAKRMVGDGDRIVRDSMVRDGVVIEGLVVVRGVDDSA